ncbi:Endonuclease/exonuclease/phosphatase [Polychytrium aggregatum]|uniref:Endonuclease/exonuclease/phosphatase n=1 Tax=Polychytrium aggregatum TaxID=110093 RepID=UPI0022FEBC6D|nr:Endonuclease/exonuclease/phosphatase [Polychytrium aggregatum]KAI9197434.1 Endonuclease/exonuclease/phosphatase [Polychytrium aggregatum]
MRILCWNVNGIRAVSRKLASGNGLLSFFRQQNLPDIVCFQETKVSGLDDLADSRELIEVPGYDSFWSFSKKRKGWSGVVTYAKKGSTLAASEGFGDDDFNDEGRCVMTDHGDFVLFNVYFVNGGRGEERLQYKLDFYESFQRRCQALIASGREIIVTGDVNTAHKDIDVHDPKRLINFSGFMPKERAWIDRFLEEGFVDAFRQHHPDLASQYTFWDTKTGKRPLNLGWRIDYFFVSSGLSPRVETCEHHPDVMGSDHCPLSLSLSSVDLHSDWPTPSLAAKPKGGSGGSRPGGKITSFFKPVSRKSDTVEPADANNSDASQSNNSETPRSDISELERPTPSLAGVKRPRQEAGSPKKKRGPPSG